MLRHCFIFVSLFLSAYSQSTLCSQWNEQPNTNTPGGTDMPVARTLDDCKSACLNSSTSCVYGFDWSTTGGTGTLCWISRTSVTTVAQGVSHYTCPSIKTTPGIQGSTTTTLPSGATARPACSSTLQYTQYPDSNIQGSIKQPSLTQLDTCQNGCMSTSWCSGIDWNSGAAAEEKCWFTLKSQNDIQVNKYPGVTHYHLVCSGGPATDSSGTGQAPAGCSWVELSNTNSPNGNQVQQANTLSGCKAACLASTDKCSANGFDWNPSNPDGSKCYLSTMSVLNSGASSISHFSLKCDSTTSLYVTSTPAGSYSCSWNALNDTNSPGGVLQSSLVTFEQCRDTCLQLKNSSCMYGFDWNPTVPQGSRCWFSTSKTTASYPGVTHYNAQCSLDNGGTAGGCVWTPLANTNSPGGIVQSSTTTLDQCQSSCLQQRTTTCLFGFDWNPTAATGSQCWFSTSATTTSNPGVTHYNYNCIGVTTTGPSSGCSWITLTDQNSPGGILQNSVTSLDQCKNLCQQGKDTSCKYGIDWNTASSVGTQCWISQSNVTSSAPGINHLNLVCQGCSWNKASNTNSPGGNVQPSITTLQQCQDSCQQNPNTCKFGFDFNPNNPTGSQCWFSSSATTTSANGVDHYTYICNNPGITSTPSGVGGCAWNKASNTNSPGGIVQPSLTTLQQCQDSCQQNPNTCRFGFDFNPNNPTGSQCWFSSSATTTSANGVDHYAYSCNSVTTGIGGCSWNKASNTNSPGGIVQPSITTLQQCQDSCQQNPNTCRFGFDFNPNNPTGSQCWFSSSATTTSASGVDHYTYSCTSVTTGIGGCSWNKASNTNSPGGIVQPSLTTLQQCQDSCQQNPNTCRFGFDFNPNNPTGSQCWFSSSATTTSASGVDHYTYSCTSGSGGCTWNKLSNTNSPGGTVQPSITTLQQCRDSCQQNPNTCKFGFDFNPNNPTGSQCWFSSSATTTSANGVDHYNCLTNGLTPTVLQGCTWSNLNDTNTQGGLVQPSLTTLDQCKDECLRRKDSDCKSGFDWNPGNSVGAQCWFSQTNITGSYPGVQHYYLTCPGAATPAPSPACTWFEAPNTNSPGGAVQPSYTTIEACKSYCISYRFTLCKFGIDFNPTAAQDFRCWFSASNSTTTYPGTSHLTYSCV